MVDEKVDDQVWVTVVATGYGDRAACTGHARGRGARTPRGPRHPGRRRAPTCSRSRERVPRARSTTSTCRSSCPRLRYGSRHMKGVVAAGHPLTARAGADVLRAGGNAVDAAVAAVLMSFVAESPLTGPGRRRLHARHTAGGEDHLLDFFVAAPGRGLRRSRARGARADRRPLHRGRRAALQRRAVVLRRLRHPARPRARRSSASGRVALGELTAAPARAAREGVEVVPLQAFLFESSRRSSAPRPSARRSTRRAGGCCAEGDAVRLPELGDLLDRLGAEGPASSTAATWPRA